MKEDANKSSKQASIATRKDGRNVVNKVKLVIDLSLWKRLGSWQGGGRDIFEKQFQDMFLYEMCFVFCQKLVLYKYERKYLGKYPKKYIIFHTILHNFVLHFCKKYLTLLSFGLWTSVSF